MSESQDCLFTPLQVGAIACANRIFMAPLTRNRAPAATPTALMAEYYAQRAGAGLIVSEASQISPEGQGYMDTPGIYSAAQREAWRAITQAVHAAGGRIVLQLWHVGRISHVSLLPAGTQPVSSTARAAQSQTVTREGFVACSTPRALAADELPRIVNDYRQAAALAVAAGFDGVEVHAANGYLIEQFLRDSINDRGDAWGGSVDNRTRLLAEVMAAVCAEIGADRCGLRLSPVTPANDAGPDSNPQALYARAVERVAALKPAFIHVVEGATGGPRDVAPFDYAALRALYRAAHPEGRWVVNNGYTAQMAAEAVASGRADAVAFGRPFIPNPDLPQRIRLGAPWAKLNRETLYGGGAAGYTDYPAWSGAA